MISGPSPTLRTAERKPSRYTGRLREPARVITSPDGVSWSRSGRRSETGRGGARPTREREDRRGQGERERQRAEPGGKARGSASVLFVGQVGSRSRRGYPRGLERRGSGPPKGSRRYPATRVAEPTGRAPARRPSSRSRAGGSGVTGSAAGCMAAPHSWQNRCPGSLRLPHAAQTISPTFAPQDPQNLAVAGLA